MRKAVLAVLCVALAGVVALAQPQQINVLFEWPEEIDGSKPSYVEHGVHAIAMPMVAELGFESPRELALATTEVRLWIDNEEIPARGLKLPSWIDPFDGMEVFDIHYFWRFPANYFSEGFHEITVYWSCSFIPREPLTKTLLVNVFYPPHRGNGKGRGN